VDNTITADILGSEATMVAVGSFGDACGYLGTVTVDDSGSNAGKVTAIVGNYSLLGDHFGDASALNALEVYSVVSIDALSGVIVLNTGSDCEVCDVVEVVYSVASKWDGSQWTYYDDSGSPVALIDAYVGLEGPSVGDKVFASSDDKVLLLHDDNVDLAQYEPAS